MGIFKKSDDELIKQLTSKKPEQRRDALKNLRERKTKSAAIPIVSMMRSESDYQNLVSAIIALRGIEDSQGMQLGIEALDNIAKKTRVDAWGFNLQTLYNLVYAMGFSGSPIFFEYLVSASRHMSSEVRWHAQLGLSYLGLPWAYNILVDELNRELDKSVKTWTFQAIRELCHPDGLFIFSSLAFSSDLEVRDQAQNGLKWLASAIGLELYLPDYVPESLRNKIDTLERAINNNFKEYINRRVLAWLKPREFYVQHLLSNECIIELKKGQSFGPDPYSEEWSRNILTSLDNFSGKR